MSVQCLDRLSEMAVTYSVVSRGETASEFLQPHTGLLQHVRVLMALKLQANNIIIMKGAPL